MLLQRFIAGIGQILPKLIVVIAAVALGLSLSGLISATAMAADDSPMARRIDPVSSPFMMRTGVAVDPAEGRLYMMSPQGAIDAVEIASGRLLWTTKAAAKPLAVFDVRLAAQAEALPGNKSLPVVLLDTRHEGRVVSTIKLPLPAGVTLSINEGPGSSSSVQARVEQSNLIIWWSSSQWTISGIPGSAEPRRSESGAASVDLKTLRVETLTPEQATARLREGTVSSNAPRLSGTEALLFPPQRAGEFFFSVKLGPASAGTPAVLKRWSWASGDPLPDVDLGPGFSASALSGDGKLFLITKAAGADAAGVQNYRWSIYSIASGELVAKILLPQAAPPFFIWHSVLVFESDPHNRRVNGAWLVEPLELRAFDVKTGNEIWKRALRNTRFSGPLPPASS